MGRFSGLTAFLAVLSLAALFDVRDAHKVTSKATLQATYEVKSTGKHGTSHLKERADSMSLHEALSLVGHRIPDDVKGMIMRDPKHPHVHLAAQPKSKKKLSGLMTRMNDMQLDAQRELDVTDLACQAAMTSLEDTMKSLEEDKTNMEEDLTEDYGDLTQWEYRKQEAEKRLVELSEILVDHKKECAREREATKSLLAVQESDFEVSSKVLASNECSPELQKKAAARPKLARLGRTLLQEEDDIRDKLKAMSGPVLLSCVLPDGNSFMKFEDKVIAQQVLLLSARRASHVSSTLLELSSAFRNDSIISGVGSTSPSTPTRTAIPQDLQDAKCTITKSPQCPKFNEAMAELVSEVQNEVIESQDHLVEHAKNCTRITKNINEESASWEEQLVLATRRYTELLARTRGLVVGLQELEHTRQMTMESLHKKADECSAALADASNTICGLRKIKKEMTLMSGVSTDQIMDCEVSAWEEGDCSSECGEPGGIKNLTRTIVTDPSASFGCGCPPLTAQVVCNNFPCPVDCEMGHWSQFTKCSAQCGIGTKLRFRDVTREPRYQGRPCDAREDSPMCEAEACDVDCQLAPWTPWGPCDMACGGGKQERRRAVAVEKKGEGLCPMEDSSARFEVQECNVQACPPLKPICQAKADIVVVVDSSGSLSADGFEQAKKFIKQFISQIEMDEEHAQVGLIEFSDRVSIISELTANKKKLLKRANEMDWMASLTSTADALVHAGTMLDEGREDANSIVLVLTDGMPTGKYPSYRQYSQTPSVARKLRRKARVVIVGIGRAVSGRNMRKMRSWATEGGKYHNFVKVVSFPALTAMTDDIIVGLCPEIKDLTSLAPTGSPASLLAVREQMGLDAQQLAYLMQRATYNVSGLTWGDDIRDEGGDVEHHWEDSLLRM